MHNPAVDPHHIRGGVLIPHLGVPRIHYGEKFRNAKIIPTDHIAVQHYLLIIDLNYRVRVEAILLILFHTNVYPSQAKRFLEFVECMKLQIEK